MRIRTKRLVSTFAGLILVGMLAHTAISEDKAQPGKADNGAAKPAAATDAPGGPDAKMMEEMMKMGAPGEQHQMLKKLVGTWDAEVTMKMADGAPETKSKGKEVNTMLLGDRFLKSDFTGEMMGMPFNGMSLTGYDNMKKKFINVWVDSVSTGAMISEGDADSSGRKITMTGECPCMAEGGKIKAFRQVWTIQDNDHHEFEMFQPGPDGKEVRGLHIKYTRVK